MKYRMVRGTCPACGHDRLALSPAGTIVCCFEFCDRPSAAAEILAERDVLHVVELHRDDFTLRHPLRERLDDALFDCRLHDAIAASDGPPAPPGRYRVRPTSTGLHYDPLPTAPSPTTTKENQP